MYQNKNMVTIKKVKKPKKVKLDEKLESVLLEKLHKEK